jgi:two-component system, OmpR family, alkaline phosphatase synthesis response regulator PhoP
MALILIVEDEKDIVNLIKYNLEKSGFKSIAIFNGDEALDNAKKKKPDLIVLDIMLPGADGFEICKKLRADALTRKIPIIMLTARKEEVDKVLGLELGADDYLTKPFSPRELIARIKAVLRRHGESSEKDISEIKNKDLAMDLSKREVKLKGKLLELTAKEFDLLEYLLKNKGKVLTRDVLLNHIWGYDYYGTTRTVDVHVQRLREKLLKIGEKIQTVRNVGYKYRD